MLISQVIVIIESHYYNLRMFRSDKRLTSSAYRNGDYVSSLNSRYHQLISDLHHIDGVTAIDIDPYYVHVSIETSACWRRVEPLVIGLLADYLELSDDYHSVQRRGVFAASS